MTGPLLYVGETCGGFIAEPVSRTPAPREPRPEPRNADLPAHPVKISHEQFSHADTAHPGLTKRELIAAMALQGLLANPGRLPLAEVVGPPGQWERLNALVALDFADALLAQLGRNDVDTAAPGA